MLQVDGCKNYTVLSEADRAQASTSRGDLCDGSLLTGWYRFQGPAGDQMLDKCVPMYHCGAWFPGWLNGAHPTVDEGVVVRTACFHAGINMCCATSNNIKVKNCSSYYVYELQKTYGCPLRYCGNADAGKLHLVSLCISLSQQPRYKALVVVRSRTNHKSFYALFFTDIKNCRLLSFFFSFGI